jgi:hypothetical protein
VQRVSLPIRRRHRSVSASAQAVGDGARMCHYRPMSKINDKERDVGMIYMRRGLRRPEGWVLAHNNIRHGKPLLLAQVA